MRIAMLARRFDPAGGGTERDFAAAATCLAGAGHQVRIYAARARVQSWREMEVRRVFAPSFPRSLEVIAFGLLASRFARRGGADFVISFGRVAGSDFIRCEGGAHAAYLEAARQWESRAASAIRMTSPYHRAQSWMEARGFSSPQLKMVLSISRLVADDLARRFAIARGKMEVLYNGVDHVRFTGAAAGAQQEYRRRLGVERSPCLVLFVGNGFGRKGLGQLLEAWPVVDRRATLVIAGEDHASEFYQRMARRLELDDRVLFLGKRDDVADLMKAADIVALPSLFEAFGNVVLEAMASGLPVLTSARCGAAEVLPAQLQEFVVHNPMDTAEVAGRLNALLAAPRELGAIAQKAAAQFTWDRYANRLLELIEIGTASRAVADD